MAGPALGALVLVLLLAGRAASTGTGGGLCAREDAHRCPQLRYGADAQLCCSTCRLFCCPAGEAQLQGRRGPREAPATPGPSTTQPSTPTNTPLPPPTEPWSFKLKKGWAGLLALAGLLAWITLWIVFRYWRKQRWRQRRSAWHAGLLSLWNPRWPHLEELDLSSFLGTPPPYAADPPPYSEEEPESSPPQAGPSCLSSPGSSEEEVMIEPLGRQNFAAGCLLESTLEEDPSAEQ